MFSSGAGSWAAARRVADEYGTSDLFLVFADVKGNNPSPHAGEDEDNYRFLKEASADIGGTLVWLNEGRDIWQAFKDKRYLGNTRLANAELNGSHVFVLQDAGTSCPKGTTAISWNAQGPTGTAAVVRDGGVVDAEST